MRSKAAEAEAGGEREEYPNNVQAWYREAAVWEEAAEMVEARPANVVVVHEAPGDLCGGSRLLEDGSKCPGCRACS
jgi:hypothetical protein